MVILLQDGTEIGYYLTTIKRKQIIVQPVFYIRNRVFVAISRVLIQLGYWEIVAVCNEAIVQIVRQTVANVC